MRRSFSIPNINFPLPKLQAHLYSQINSNSAIKSLVQGCHFIRALNLYIELYRNGMKSDNFTLPYLLKAASKLEDPSLGFQIHTNAFKTGFDINLFVSNSLILFYGKFGYLDAVHMLFDAMPERNIVSWTATMSAYTQHDRSDIAIALFHDMRITGLKSNSFTIVTILPNFTGSRVAIQIHGFLIKCGFDQDEIVTTALVDVYSKSRKLPCALQLFDEMPQRNLVLWNTLTSAYAHNGLCHYSLKFFALMQSSPENLIDSYTIVTLLTSCSILSAMRHGKEVHGHVYRNGFEREILVSNSLIDMYGKCGCVDYAKKVFQEMPKRCVDSWTALISCYGRHGFGVEAISIFEKMKTITSIVPNSVTFISLLSACSHSLLVEDGLRYFRDISHEFGMKPDMKHYVCVVDMLGRAGYVEKALEFINEMTVTPDCRVWEALLGGASIHGNSVIAEIAAKFLIELKPENPDLHVQLSNVYAKEGQWDEVSRIRGKMMNKKFLKTPGISSVKVLK